MRKDVTGFSDLMKSDPDSIRSAFRYRDLHISQRGLKRPWKNGWNRGLKKGGEGNA